MHGWQKINSNSAPTKQKLFFFHSFRHQSLLPLSSLTRLLLVVTTSLCPILIGFILDSELSMKKHVIKICQTAYFKLKCISSIRRFLTEGATQTLVTSYIPSRLDYCNRLLMGAPNSVIQPLQNVQNFAARLILMAPRHHHSAPLLKKLHWLPVSERVKYKVACMCFHAMNGSGLYLPLWTLTYLHSVSHASFFFGFPPAVGSCGRRN